MLEEQPVSAHELVEDDEVELRRAKKLKAKPHLPFAKSGEQPSYSPINESVPLEPQTEHEIDLRSGQSNTRRVSEESTPALPNLEEIYAAPPMPPAIDESLYETAGLPEGHHLQQSEWLNIELDKAGRVVEKPVNAYGAEFYHEQLPEKTAELEYEDMGQSEEEEVAAASGQLAVSTLSDDDSLASEPTGNFGYEGSIMALFERVVDSLKDIRQGFGSFTAFDVVLWSIFLLIIIAIIFAIRA